MEASGDAMNARFAYCALSALLFLGCAGHHAGVLLANPALAQIVAPDGSEKLLNVTEAIAQVESLRAKKTMASYQQAMDLLAQIVRIDESQQPLATAVQAEFDDYLWALHTKFEQSGEDLQRNHESQLKRLAVPATAFPTAPPPTGY